MNLYNLKIFADTARLGSMTKASELNHLSRPAVSQAIKKLEFEIGVELLIHQRRAVELTPAGRMLLMKSNDLLNQIEKTVLSLRQGVGLYKRDFRIGSARTLATFNLLPILKQLKEDFPEVSLQIQMANSGALIRKLENREIDLAFYIGDESLEGSTQVVVGRGHYVLLKPRNAKANLEFAITEKRPETERLRVLFERQNGHPLPVFAELHSWDAIFQAVKEGICGGLVPDFLLSSKPNEKHLNYVVSIPKVFPFEIKAVYLGSKSVDPLVKSFVGNFKKAYNE